MSFGVDRCWFLWSLSGNVVLWLSSGSWVLVWVGRGGLWILVWIGEVGLLWFEQRLCGSRWEVAGGCKIPIWQSSPSWVQVFFKNCWFGLICVWLSYWSFVEFETLWLAWAWHRESFCFLAWRWESKEKGMRGLRLTVLESVWT